jgi:hypothetical protein
MKQLKLDITGEMKLPYCTWLRHVRGETVHVQAKASDIWNEAAQER